MTRIIVLVGHCGPDASLLGLAVSRAVPTATIEVINDIDSLSAVASAGALYLVNRVLEGEFGGSHSGIELIRLLTQQGGSAAAMLISNFPEAQAEAVAAGALPGFGKRSLYAESTAAMLQDAAG